MADRVRLVIQPLAEQVHTNLVVKGKGTLNSVIRSARGADGVEIKVWRGKGLRTVAGKLRRHRTIDPHVSWNEKGYTLDSRLLVTWNETEDPPRYLVTKLPREHFSLERMCDAYRLRWQVGLMFKEWKSYANLHAFGTQKASVAEGLIWATLCAAIMKRFLAHAAQRVHRVGVSTRKAAIALRFRLTARFHALMAGGRRLGAVIKETLCFLAGNARRSHPNRESSNGRSKLNLRPVLGEA